LLLDTIGQVLRLARETILLESAPEASGLIFRNRPVVAGIFVGKWERAYSQTAPDHQVNGLLVDGLQHFIHLGCSPRHGACRHRKPPAAVRCDRRRFDAIPDLGEAYPLSVFPTRLACAKGVASTSCPKRRMRAKRARPNRVRERIEIQDRPSRRHSASQELPQSGAPHTLPHSVPRV